MVLQEVKFQDGSRIYYKYENSTYRRVIQYSFDYYVDNAGKYYYLKVLEDYRDIGSKVYLDLKHICELTTANYSPDVNMQIGRNFTKEPYGDYESILFTVIYLAMVDMEESKKDASWPGKWLVLESCRQVLLENVPSEKAATYKP